MFNVKLSISSLAFFDAESIAVMRAPCSEATDSSNARKICVSMSRGKSRPNERVFYTAHWDHEGISLPDAKGDRIYNGAIDNASGTDRKSTRLNSSHRT